MVVSVAVAMVVVVMGFVVVVVKVVATLRGCGCRDAVVVAMKLVCKCSMVVQPTWAVVEGNGDLYSAPEY